MTLDPNYRAFLTSEGRVAHLPSLVQRAFNLSYSESKRLVAEGQVELDGEVTHLQNIPVDQVAGKELRVGRESVEVGT